MSCIFYRFKSQKTDSRLPIDGTGISVFDLKKEIILANHMGEGKDFDLGLYDASAEEGLSLLFLLTLLLSSWP
jgi:protein MPE1